MGDEDNRFFWVKVTDDGPWLPARLDPTDPNFYLIPGSQFSTSIVREGPEIFQPAD